LLNLEYMNRPCARKMDTAEQMPEIMNKLIADAAEADAKCERLCFDSGDYGYGACDDHAPIAVLHCGAFLLWQLPDAPTCPSAYCVAPSGLFGG
jgi:hypothetical protein